MPVLLALDASLARCSAALLAADGALLGAREVDVAQGQPARLPELAAEVFALAAGAELLAVAAVVGPGSFTGIRTALALARGMALAAGCPCLGVTTGEALAAGLPDAEEVWAVLDTRRGGFFLERLRGGAPLGPPVSLAPADLPAPEGLATLAGDAAPLAAERLAARGFAPALSELRLPRARDAGRAALRRLRGGLPPLPARPLYVEPPAVR